MPRRRTAEAVIGWIDAPGVGVVSVHDDARSHVPSCVVDRALNPHGLARLVCWGDASNVEERLRETVEDGLAAFARKTNDRCSALGATLRAYPTGSNEEAESHGPGDCRRGFHESRETL